MGFDKIFFAAKISLHNDSSVVQSVERRTVNPYVTGSSPVRGAKFKKPAQETKQAFCFQRVKWASNFSLAFTLIRGASSIIMPNMAAIPVYTAGKPVISATRPIGAGAISVPK